MRSPSAPPTRCRCSSRRCAATRCSPARLGRDPTDEEIAQAAELDLSEIEEAREAARVVTSLDRPVGEEDETSLGALLPSGERGPDEEVDIALREDALRQALDRLPER